jgi:hypothetical protein
MTTIHNAGDRAAILNRFARLEPDTLPEWGKLDAPRMVTHVTDTLRSGLGEVVIKPKGGPLQYWPLNTMVMFYLPWPKGVPTAPELISRAPTDLKAEVDTLRAAMDRFGACDVRAPWPAHAAFGRISGSDWGRLMYRHLDYHLRQFGL